MLRCLDFGSSNTGSNSLFGTNTNANNTSTSGGLFGTPNTSSTFGTKTPGTASEFAKRNR